MTAAVVVWGNSDLADPTGNVAITIEDDDPFSTTVKAGKTSSSYGTGGLTFQESAGSATVYLEITIDENLVGNNRPIRYSCSGDITCTANNISMISGTKKTTGSVTISWSDQAGHTADKTGTISLAWQ